MTSGSQSRRKWGQRGRNQYLEGQWTVIAVNAVGEPFEPPKVCAKFRNAIGAIIRTKMVLDPTIPNWLTVPKGKKNKCEDCCGKHLFCQEELNKK
jgi:hypothetical protein